MVLLCILNTEKRSDTVAIYFFYKLKINLRPHSGGKRFHVQFFQQQYVSCISVANADIDSPLSVEQIASSDFQIESKIDTHSHQTLQTPYFR